MNLEDIWVSVVIPTYARNDTLVRAIKCVQEQTHEKLDIIVVDDNPEDSPYRESTEKLMLQFSNDKRVRYIKNSVNLGGSGARNVGIEASMGEYVAFLDDDDLYYPNKIEKQLELFLRPNSEKLALVYSDVEHCWADGRRQLVVKAKHRGNCLYEAIVDDCIASTSMWLTRKSALNDVGNFSIVPCKQDSTVIIKLLAAGYEVDFVPEILTKYINESGGQRISFNGKKAEGERLFYELCKENFDRFTKKQIESINYSFDKRLYIYYSYAKAGSEGEKIANQLAKKMFSEKPLDTIKILLRRNMQKAKKQVKQLMKGRYS